MKYLLSYKGFCRFAKEWEVHRHGPLTDLNDSVIHLQHSNNSIKLVSDIMECNKDGVYEGEVFPVHGLSCLFLPLGTTGGGPIKLIPADVAGKSFTFSLPVKYHTLKQYHVHYANKVKQCILVNEVVLADLERIGITC